MKKKLKKRQHKMEMGSVTRFMVAMLGGVSGYVGAEVFLRSQPHPWHWITALVLGILTYGGLSFWQTSHH